MIIKMNILTLKRFLFILIIITQLVFINCNEIDSVDTMKLNCSENFDVTLIYSRYHSELYLNISNLTGSHAIINVFNNNNNIVEPYFTFLENDTFIIVPPLNEHKHMFTIEPDHNYTIIIDNSDNEFSCHIPDCFKLCKCTSGNIRYFNATLMNDGNAINISWLFVSNSEISTNITHLHLNLIPYDEDLSNKIDINYFVYPLELNQTNFTYTFDLRLHTNHSCYYNATTDFHYINEKRNKISHTYTYTSFLITFFVIICIILLITSYFCIPKFMTFIDKMRECLKKRRVERDIIVWHSNEYYKTIDLSYEIDKKNIEKIAMLKSGEFGEVYLAKLSYEYCNDIRVAVKRPKLNSQEAMDDFMTEINTLRILNTHVNVVKLIGFSIKTIPYLMVMELVASGDLKSYLIDLREEWQKNRSNRNKYEGTYIFNNNTSLPTTPTTPSSNISNTDTIMTTLSSVPTTPTTPLTSTSSNYMQMSSLDNNELHDFALQIARGMEHVENLNITHRDLAARNVLISESKVLKISDFGMSRVTPYYQCKTKKIPIRWWPIESIIHGYCNSKSDVWSYGVVLWEIGTLAALPYCTIRDDELTSKLLQGLRLDKPTMCTNDLYDLMLSCWNVNNAERPSFKDIVRQLSENKKKIYVDFSEINPKYIFPPPS